MIKGKKGVELSLNVVIISILVILVLFVLILFFTGGAGNAISKIRQLFQGQTLDLNSAVIQCNAYCSNYETTGNNRQKDLFCGDKKFRIDFDGDGQVDNSEATCLDVGASCSRIPEC